MCLNPLPPPSERCDDVMTNARRVFVNNLEKNVIKTQFVETYQRKGWLCFMFYLFLVMMTVTLFSRVSIVSRAQKFLWDFFGGSLELRIRFYSWKTSSDQDKTSLKHNTS